MSQEVFRRLYREPLRRTRNQTIARYDLSVLGARASTTKFTGDERSIEAGRRGAAVRRAGMSDEDKRIFAILGGKARVRDGSLTKAAAEDRRRRFAAMTPEQRRSAVAKLQAGRMLKREAKWPFPVAKVHKLESLARARAAMAAKRARERLAVEARRRRR